MSIISDINKNNIEELIKCGALIALNSVTIYHGRAKDKDQKNEWKVNPKFVKINAKAKNLKNITIPTLSTAGYDVASFIANNRAMVKKTIPEIHRIVPYNPNSYVINSKFSSKNLSKELKDIITTSIRSMTTDNLSFLLPSQFEDRDIYDDIYKFIISLKKDQNFITDEEILKYEDIYIRNGISLDKVFRITGAINTRTALELGHFEQLTNIMLKNTSSSKNLRFSLKTNDEIKKMHLNLEYFINFLNEFNIVGVKNIVDEDTLIPMEDYLIFDRLKINTEKSVDDLKNLMSIRYTGIAKELGFPKEEFLRALSQSTTPEATMQFFNSLKDFNELLKLDSGVWEKFTISEHTETVLRCFQDNFDEKISKEIVPIIKFIIVLHDIGKGKAQQMNEKSAQKKYNLIQAKKLMRENNFSEKFQDFVLDIIQSQDITTELMIRKNRDAKNKLFDFCSNILINLLDREPSYEEIIGLMGICKILQICDSGAYTRYATTRNEKTDLYYKNGSELFTYSFKQPWDLAGKKLEFTDNER